MINAYIAGCGIHLPERRVTNFDLMKVMDTSDSWIQERTGIVERRYADPGTGSSDLALPASQAALKEAGIGPEDLDHIIFATSTPDYWVPGSGCLLQDLLGCKPIGATDVRAQCSGFVYSLSIADAFIRAGIYRNVLVVGAEVQSNGLDFSTAGRDTAVIFADGAGAVVVRATDKVGGILSTHLHSDGRYAKELWVEAPSSKTSPRLSPEILAARKHFLCMNGSEVFKHAVTKFPEVIEEALKANNVTSADVALVVPHQANLRITQAIQKRLGVPAEKIMSNIDKYGNTTAASIPIALKEAKDQGRIKSGDLIVLASFGSGFSWASALIRWI
jgi:3-oxoacyl-[acyl-carrier-protein] synthase-3